MKGQACMYVSLCVTAGFDVGGGFLWQIFAAEQQLFYG